MGILTRIVAKFQGPLTSIPASPKPCKRCKNRGLMLVRYHSGEPTDIAICDCPKGDWWQHAGEAYIRLRFPMLTGNTQIAPLAAFDEPVKELTPAEKDAQYHRGLLR